MRNMRELLDLVRRAERRAEALKIVSYSLEALSIRDPEGVEVRTAMLGAADAVVDALADVVRMAEAELDTGIEGHCPD
jgi:hypothetical protein